MVERNEFPRAPFSLGLASLLLFFLSALSGLFAAYIWAVAVEKFLALLIGMAIALCLACIGRLYQRWVVPAALGVVILALATNTILMALQPLTLASLVDRLTEPIVILLPLCLGWLISLQRRDTRQSGMTNGFAIERSAEVIVAGIGAVALAGFAFLLIRSGDTSSGLALLLGTMVVLWLLAQQWLSPRQRRVATPANRWLMALAVVIVAVYTWSIMSPAAGDMMQRWVPRLVPARLQRYHDFLAIIADYPFTGSGLGVSEMVYSTYLFMVQVPFLAQAHNLFLQLAVEQGIPGLLGYVGLLVATLWAMQHTLARTDSHEAMWEENASTLYVLAAATVGSLVALIVNGMLDADIYGSLLVALVFVPIGTAWGLFFAGHALPTLHFSEPFAEPFADPYALVSRWNTSRRVGWSGLSGTVGLLPFLLVALMFLRPGGFASAYANAGAVAQTQAELSIYDNQTWAVQDQVRRTSPGQLTLAERFYTVAIALNPYNVTAHWRLGQIELSQGQYAEAEQHLIQAYALAPQHRAVRQLLGEVYAIQGKVEPAIQLWKPLDVGQNQLQLREWWYEMIGDSNRAKNFQETVRTYEQTACCP
jgi:tetratricopeptide (TPR) repeat protein